MVDEANSIECPFSDHSFLLASLNIRKEKEKSKIIKFRNLSVANLDKISTEIDSIDWKPLRNLKSIEDKWLFLKDSLIKIIDSIAPLKEISIKMHNQFPWYDEELIILKHSYQQLQSASRRQNTRVYFSIFTNFVSKIIRA
ncbi:unnamed protein product [Brachionus calyciflorus]|uniref:Uncharacterized protein n=1 Tax=Brachionus calyciflorus TaxID=104777 RepID=A0A813UDW2_9BILA|nr:unnamed protein product [Brachionus calyciflorus]